MKSSLHSLAPYVGKLLPELASNLINEFSQKKEVVFDPFCGSGTVCLEAWANGRNVLGVDLNYYAFLITMAKLHPYPTLANAQVAFEKYCQIVKKQDLNADLRKVPKWVRAFFHNKTLKEIISWTNILLKNKEWFFLACLMGILHHQRPGFLSYPSSHGAPYLRIQKFPIEDYPELYEYRSVEDRLLMKITRAYKHIPDFDFSINREVFHCNTLDLNYTIKQDMVIITSPPYMKSLTYARDNRLRLWFLGYPEWCELDSKISMGKNDFFLLMKNCFERWSHMQKKDNYCILIIGDIEFDKETQKQLPDVLFEMAKSSDYNVIEIRDYPVNTDRKFEKKNSQIKNEKICVFRKEI
jgi:DNA modification methylase